MLPKIARSSGALSYSAGPLKAALSAGPLKAGSLMSVLAALSSALWAGCVGLAPMGDAPGRPVEIARAVDAAPAPFGEAARPMPALIQTIYANGAVWFGQNLGTALTGDLDMYDSGEGLAVGLAFGNGQDVKRFFEVAYEMTERHQVFQDYNNQYYDSTSVGVATGVYERFYFGLRRYLLPVAAEESRRIAPMVVAGVTVQRMDGNVPIRTAVGSVMEAHGLGFYFGTGLEVYVGGSSQIAIALDVRASLLDFDGFPESTGRMGQAGAALSVVYHF